MRQHGVAIRSRTGAALAIPALRRPAEPCFISTSGWESRNTPPGRQAGAALMLAVYVDTVPAALAEGPEALHAAGFEVRDAVATTPADVVAAARGATALLVGDSPVSAEVFAALDELAIVSTITVGVDHIDLEAAAAHGTWVANVPDATTEEVATTSGGVVATASRTSKPASRRVCGPSTSAAGTVST